MSEIRIVFLGTILVSSQSFISQFQLLYIYISFKPKKKVSLFLYQERKKINKNKNLRLVLLPLSLSSELLLKAFFLPWQLSLKSLSSFLFVLLFNHQYFVMDIGVHFLGSVTSNENGSPGQKELRGTKQDRSGFDGEDCLQRNSKKIARTTTTEEENLSSSSFPASYYKTMSFHQGIPLVRSASPLSSDSRRQEHMLSFSDKPEALDFSKYVGLDNNNSNKTSLSPFLHQLPPPPYFRSSGLNTFSLFS